MADEAKAVGRGKTLVLGSKHQRPVLEVSSPIGSDEKIDPAHVRELLFNPDGSHKYKGSRYIPMFAAGADTTIERAVEIFRQFVTTVSQLDAADHVKVESASGETLYDGPAYEAFPRSNDAKMSAPARVLKYLQDSYKLAHMQDINGSERKRALSDAEAKGWLVAPTKRGGGRASTDSKLV